MKLSTPDGKEITRWEDWTRPKRDYQWADGRSAKELAKAWFTDGQLAAPAEFMKLLLSDPRLHGLKLIRGAPEFVTALRERGQGRNHDLWLFGETASESVTICVEAKADEPFGSETIADYRAAALERKQRGESTKAPERIDALLEMVPGSLAGWDPIRYQLLTAICGTALQAKQDGATIAVFVVHEFHTSKTAQEFLDRNRKDYEKFLGVIGIPSSASTDSTLHGPVTIDGTECLVGKVVRTIV